LGQLQPPMEGAGQQQDAAPLQELDSKALRRELRKLRRGREVLAMRVNKARRELARTRKRQKETERQLLDSEAAVSAVSRRLGLASEGLPEIQEWRTIAHEHMQREKELSQQIEEEKAAHDRRLAQLQEELKKNGRPESVKSVEAEEWLQNRWTSDEQCGRIQAICDYVDGKIEDVSARELCELVRSPEEPPEDDELEPGLGQYQELVDLILEELRVGHAENTRNLMKLCNTVLGRKDTLLKMLAYDVIGRGLEDLKLCTPGEQAALRELLKDVETICEGFQTGANSS